MAELLAGTANVHVLVFSIVLVTMIAWEAAAPRRDRSGPRLTRWVSNLGMGLLNRLMLSVAPMMSAALVASERFDWALLNLLQVPLWASILITLLLLDALVYWQHRLFHMIPLMWRVHRLHHTDTDFDATTAVRFHPIEALVSMLIKAFAVMCIGPPAVAVLIFEIVLSATALFNHSNARLPLAVDRWLRTVLVTPDMHRVHHSTNPAEYNRNFGFNLPWWDHLFGSYLAQPQLGHRSMQIGLDRFRSAREARLPALLVQPFKS